MNSSCTDYQIYEPKVGVFIHEVWVHNNLTDSSKIRIFKDNGTATFGDEVFLGSLQELIDRLTEWEGVTA